jgi:2-methylcitrate dehydratase PrpD
MRTRNPEEIKRTRANSPHGHFTRRKLMSCSVGALAAAAISSRAGAAEEEISAVTARLSTYMSEAKDRALPAEVLEETKNHVLDTFAAMISGSELPPGRQAVGFAKLVGRGEGTATVAGTTILCGPIDAAIANGAMAHADETDDNYSAGGAHPGCAVIPAALALGEELDIDGTHFLRAVTLGYDVGMRAMKTVLDRTVLRDTHNIVGTFGAAAAAGCAARLNARQMRWLLDYAAQQAGAGLAVWQRDTEHMEKAFVFGSMGARNGVTSALLIHAGWTGVSDVFAGRESFFQAYAPSADPSGLIERLGERYEVGETIIKKWSTGGPVQSPLDAILNLRGQHPFEVNQVQQVRVHLSTSAAPKVDNSSVPDLCLQYLVAIMLLDGTVSFRAAHDFSRMTEPAVMRERTKVKIIAEEQLERLLPRRVAIVEIVLADGTVLIERNDTVRGSPENPMSAQEVTDKARDLCAPVIGSSKTSRLIEVVRNLQTLKSVRELRPLLQRT